MLEGEGDLPGAERLYRDSLVLRLKLLGSDHPPDVARSRYALASLLRTRGDAEGAIQECRQVLALRGRVLGRPREAEPLVGESLELRRKALPPGHWLIASSESGGRSSRPSLHRSPAELKRPRPPNLRVRTAALTRLEGRVP